MNTQADARQQRGMELAALVKVTRKPTGEWVVPSQSGNGRYTVRLGAHASDCHCTCPDHELRGVRCKHMFAVEFTERREHHADGSETVERTVTVMEKVHLTYPQNWPAYNEAQTNEKRQFQILLHGLCQRIENLPQSKGRPRLPLADAVFCAAFKVYSTVSGRRFISDEVLCKVLCHNICCVIQSMYELGITPTFASGGGQTYPQKSFRQGIDDGENLLECVPST